MSFRFAVIRFFRSYFPPISQPTAELWYGRAKKLYLFTAFNIAGYALYANFIKDRGEAYSVDEPYMHRMMRIMDLGNATVINYGRGGKTEKYEISTDELNRAYAEKKQQIFEKYSV